MEKKKYIYHSVVCAMLMLAFFLMDTKAEAALKVENIDYDNSTITVSSDSGDQVLYFSDKNKYKWEMATDTFQEKKCTMDISWISVSKNYELTMKGDQSEDVLTVTIPKQVSNFKAKYDKRENEVIFTGAEGRKVEYRKNNTSAWADLAADMSETWKYLCENGATVYFRLKGEAGVPGVRPSKEVSCKIPGKSEAPKVAVDGANATVSVQAGWQVRRVDIVEKSGVQYVTGYFNANNTLYKDAASETGQWHTYQSEMEVSLAEIAGDALTGTKDVFLQFRKSASSSSQVSHITTIKIPARDAEPDKDKDGVSIEYISKSAFKLTISSASTSKPFEYCVVDASDVTKETINDLESVTWKTISSNTAAEVKKTEAPDGGTLFFREKSVGSAGSENFKLASPYAVYGTIDYPDATSSEFFEKRYTIDGVCTTGNTDGYIQFSFTTQFNAKISKITLSEYEDVENPSSSTVNVTSVVNTNKTASDKKDKYLVTATITNINLDAVLKEKLESGNELVLYAYIELETSGSKIDYITSNHEKGLKLHIMPKSSIDTKTDSLECANEIDVTRFVGASSDTEPSSPSRYQYETFWFNVEFGKKLGTDLSKYGLASGSELGIESVKLGNYQLKKNEYSYEKNKDGTYKFTVNLYEFEAKPELYRYYNTKQNLVIALNNREKLTGVSVKLVPPVYLDSTYAWAFKAKALSKTEQEVTTTVNGSTTKKIVYENDYSVSYTKASGSVNGVSVESLTLKSATLSGKNIIYKNNNSSGSIEFYNNDLNEIAGPLTSEAVVFKFQVNYSDGTSKEYTIQNGCTFTILA